MNHLIVPFKRVKQFDIALDMVFTVKANSSEEAKEKIINVINKLEAFETNDCQCICQDFSAIVE